MAKNQRETDEKKTKRFTIRCTESEFENIKSIAKEHNISCSDFFIRLAMNRPFALSNYDKELHAELKIAHGVLGKYVGMLKIYLDYSDKKDIPEREMREQLRKAKEAQKTMINAALNIVGKYK